MANNDEPKTGFFQVKGAKYPSYRAHLGGGAYIQTRPSWWLSKEGWNDALTKGVPEALHGVADSAGAMVADPEGYVGDTVDGLIQIGKDIKKEGWSYFKDRLKKLTKYIGDTSEDPVEGVKLPTKIALALLLKSRGVQKRTGLDKTSLDEAGMSTVIANELAGASGTKIRELGGGGPQSEMADYELFPQTRLAWERNDKRSKMNVLRADEMRRLIANRGKKNDPVEEVTMNTKNQNNMDERYGYTRTA